jgi:Vitamin B12 dependent methionine synthase, activation domain
MKQTINIPIDKIKPNATGVFRLQGVPDGKEPSQRVKQLYIDAEKLFFELVEPKGILTEISISQFSEVYSGAGKNEVNTPLQHIFPKAKYLALFAATMGAAVSQKVETMMASKGSDFASGYMLDSIASYSADQASHYAETIYKQQYDKNLKVLLYSPGYCGWHVSGQGKLFQYLNPEEIGITLNASSLMTPMKSISGVLVAGSPDIHQFENDFSFCDSCRTFNCQDRMTD